MKSFLTAIFILALFSAGYAQNQVVDPRQQAQIYVIDAQSGQEVPVTTDVAILFKNALLDLVKNTQRSQVILNGRLPQQEGRLFTVTQMGVESNINGYQVSLDYPATDNSPATNVYIFAYHVDDNTLYFFDPASQQWLREKIASNNLFALRRTATYARQLNEELANQGGGGAGVDVSVDLNAPVDADVVADVAPPAMPEYEQPECPADGYLWQPGYWSYSPYRRDYYWVPGAWVAPPSPGVLWTPPYWGYEGSRFVFHVGYWGDHVGFYGGINYGYGYGGHGYYGGEWHRGHFRYNTAVVRVNTTVVHNTYINKTVINNVVINNNHTSFNGGRGGVDVKPTPEEISASREHHLKPTPEQNGNQLSARNNPNQFVKANPSGKPPVLATPKPIVYHPENKRGAKGGNGLNGPKGNNIKQPITPVKPGQQANTDKPQGLNSPAKPVGQPANPVKPAVQSTKPAQPQGLPGSPAKSQAQPVNPAKAEAQPVSPLKPGEQPVSSAKPLSVPANPSKPDGQPANAIRPDVQPTNPAKPQGQPAKPAQPQGLPGSPAKPQGQPTTPAKPQGNPTNPAKPQGLPGTPAKQKPVTPAKPDKPKPKDNPAPKPANQ